MLSNDEYWKMKCYQKMIDEWLNIIQWLPSHDDEGDGGEPDLISAQHGCDGHVEAGSHLTVGLKHDARTQVVHRQNL